MSSVSNKLISRNVWDILVEVLGGSGRWPGAWEFPVDVTSRDMALGKTNEEEIPRVGEVGCGGMKATWRGRHPLRTSNTKGTCRCPG